MPHFDITITFIKYINHICEFIYYAANMTLVV